MDMNGVFSNIYDETNNALRINATVGATVSTAEIDNDAVTNDKLANMTQGTVKVGGAANAPTDLDANNSGQILVGDGTDINSVAVSGDATLASTGALTVASAEHAAHLADATDAHDASAISNVAAGNIVATDVQAAVNELDTDKFAVAGGTLNEGANVAVGTTTGTKIGTATTQKLGFYNATPIVQGAAVADATGGATVDAEARTAINALISRLEALGLIATV